MCLNYPRASISFKLILKICETSWIKNSFSSKWKKYHSKHKYYVTFFRTKKYNLEKSIFSKKIHYPSLKPVDEKHFQPTQKKLGRKMGKKIDLPRQFAAKYNSPKEKTTKIEAKKHWQVPSFSLNCAVIYTKRTERVSQGLPLT